MIRRLSKSFQGATGILKDGRPALPVTRTMHAPQSRSLASYFDQPYSSRDWCDQTELCPASLQAYRKPPGSDKEYWLPQGKKWSDKPADKILKPNDKNVEWQPDHWGYDPKKAEQHAEMVRKAHEAGLKVHHKGERWTPEHYGYDARKVQANAEKRKKKAQALKQAGEVVVNEHKVTDDLMKEHKAWDDDLYKVLKFVNKTLETLKAQRREAVENAKSQHAYSEDDDKEEKKRKKRDIEHDVNNTVADMTEIPVDKRQAQLESLHNILVSQGYEDHFHVRRLPIPKREGEYYLSSAIAFFSALKSLIYRSVEQKIKMMDSPDDTQTEFLHHYHEAARALARRLNASGTKKLPNYRPDRAAMEDIHTRSYKDMAYQHYKESPTGPLPKYLWKYAPEGAITKVARERKSHHKKKHDKSGQHKKRGHAQNGQARPHKKGKHAHNSDDAPDSAPHRSKRGHAPRGPARSRRNNGENSQPGVGRFRRPGAIPVFPGADMTARRYYEH